MIVYWNQKISPNIKIDEDKYGNPIYKYEEVFGEVIGAWTNSNGSNGEKLIVALPNGKLDEVIMSNCYHKTTIVDGNAIDKLFEASEIIIEKSRKYDGGDLLSSKMKYDEVFEVKKWKEAVEEGSFNTFDGSGYWVKGGYRSDDEVFSTKQLDATHVVWYNK